MKKILNVLIGSLACLFFILGGVFMVGGLRLNEAKAATNYDFDENNVVFAFGNLTDSHVGYGNNDELLRRALKQLKTYTSHEINALVFSGDQTQDGIRQQAEHVVSIIKEEYDLKKVGALLTNGNHDTYWSGCMTTAEFVDAYGEDVYNFDVDKSIVTTGNRHMVVNGYHFISVQIQTFMPNVNNMSAQTKTWLKNTLDKITTDDPYSYVFVSCHSPAKNTVYGSMDTDTDGPWGSSQELDDILKNYPQVILFSGHTHYLINDERNINQSTYTQINGGSTSDILTNKGFLENPGQIADSRTYSQGMVVEIDNNNNIRITRIDFKFGKQIKNCWYIDHIKVDQSNLMRYNRARVMQKNTAPAFDETASIKITQKTVNSSEISFDIAKDDDMVEYYHVEVFDSKGTCVREVKTLSPFYKHPDLSTLPPTHAVNFDLSTLAYPYNVKVTAYDSFGKASEPLTLEMKDTTEDDKAAAKALDDKIALIGKDVQESDENAIISLRKELNDSSYSVITYMTKYEDFCDIEATFYNKYRLTKDAAQYTPAVEDMFNNAATETKGWISKSAYTGVTLNFNSTTKNNALGINKTYSLNGLHVNFANLKIKSEHKKLAMLVSNVAKDKWFGNECLLINIDFATGNVYFGNDKSIGQSDLLKYEKLGATPFSVLFSYAENGDLVMKVKTVSGEAEFTLPAAQLSALTNLTDNSACYVSFSPWDTRTTASFDIVSIHDGTVSCPEIDGDKPSDDKTSSDKTSDDKTSEDKTSEENPTDNKKGCGSVMELGSIGCLLLACGAAITIRKKRK